MITIGCLMPTLPAHGRFVNRAVDSFHSQVYPKSWDVFIHVDADPRFSLGFKLNVMIQQCLLANPNIDFFQTLDSDDIHHQDRVRKQIQPMVDNSNLMVTGTSQIIYRNVDTGEIFKYTGHPNRWIGGLAFRRTAWEKHHFIDQSDGVDGLWQNKFSESERFDTCDDALMLCAIHESNTSKKHTTGREWRQLQSLPAALVSLAY
jgi:hypothetical protein